MCCDVYKNMLIFPSRKMIIAINVWLSFFKLEFILIKSSGTIILTSYNKVSYALQKKQADD